MDLRRLVIPKNVIQQEGFATYICMVTYTKLGTGEEQTKTKQKTSRVTLTTIKKNGAAESITILGEQVFRKHKDGTITPTAITLNAQVNGSDFRGWYYKGSNGNYLLHPLNSMSGEITLTAYDVSFINGIATMMAKSENSFDVFSLYIVEDGDKGESAPVCFLSNEMIAINVHADGSTYEQEYTSNVVAYLGDEKVTPQIGEIQNVPAGMEISSTVTEGEIQLTIKTDQGATLGDSVIESFVIGNSKIGLAKLSNTFVGNKDQGTILIPVLSPVQMTLALYWTKVKDGNTGEAAVSLLLYAPEGTVVQNGEGEVEIVAGAYKGVADISQKASFVWATYLSGEWVEIENEHQDRVVIPAQNIQGTGIIRCAMVYEGTRYTQTIT